MHSHDSRTARILVVDDEQPNLDLLADYLATEGYSNVTCIRDSRTTIEAYKSLRPDLVLLDLHMPGVDGFEILELLGQSINADEFLPILVLTADATERTKERALFSGATDFLTKPLNLSEALLRIRNLLHTRSLHQLQRHARRAAEESNLRSTFLAEASHILATSLDLETTFSVLCRTAVPRIADYCVVDLHREDGSIRRVGAAHLDRAKESALRDIVNCAPTRHWADYALYADLTEGRSLLAESASPETLEGLEVAGGDQGAGKLRPREIIAVPLATAGVGHGALVLVRSESGRSYAARDLDLARELARRAALTIENARLYSDALEATRARDELLAIVAHDLRNPLSAVAMGVAMLLDETTTPAQRKYAELVGRAAERMNRLVEDLLDAARVQTRKLRIQPRLQAAVTVVKEAVAMLQPLAEARSIRLKARVASELPPVMMDPSRVQQVLSNLVGNALKFTPAGGSIEIICELVDDEVRFAVSDTGPGIPPDQIPFIFGRFWQASDKDTRGVGLGLSIVRGIIETHGGRVWVESEPGRGATFYFTLSGAREVAEAPETGEAAATGQLAVRNR